MTDIPEPNKSDVAKREETILEFWNKNDIFNKSVSKEAPKGEYVFYDGPPFATGLPHYGHIVASVIKDSIPRYFTMQGYTVPRVWGWDCHGLPIENIVEKELGFKHKKDIEKMGIAVFNERCREQVMTYAHEWESIIPRIGRWADMKNAYRTMDKPFMESVWWVFKQLWDKGLVYEDYRSMHICPRCETTLSQQEVSEGYKDVKDISVTVKFKLKNPEKIGLSGDVYMLAWTTTPWTLPGNVALAVSSKIQYSAVDIDGKTYIASRHYWNTQGKDLIEDSNIGASLIHVIDGDKRFNIIERLPSLVGLEYEPPFDYYIKNTALKNHENGWKVYHANFVTAESGTGIAHEAPAFGSDDWELSKQVNLPFVQHVNGDGTMKAEVTDFAGMEVKSRSDDDKVRLGTDIAVLKYLQDHGTFFSKENITHSYPHCWRCDTPLLNYATSSWFVSVTKVKENLLKNAEVVNWSPEHIKEGRFGKWLEGARDWSISRQRFWASVIPVWVCQTCKYQRVFGSATELEEASGKKIHDLHKHIVDEITIACDCGGTMKRIPDVLDTWFDSGSMPYGEKHYPFENKVRFDATFPAQFIAEGIDQTRAWFYYLHVLAGAIFEKNAFQNVIVNGIVLAEDGKKMSKKLKNYPDPMDVVHKYGADALRFYLLSSSVMQAENLAFSEKGVDEIVKKNIGRLSNVLSFYQLYADGTLRDWKSENVLDLWIVSRLNELIRETTAGFESYRLDLATRPITGFIDDLSVWYLRRSRDRFKEDGEDKKAALATLRYVLHTLARVIAPSMPFFAEYLFLAIREDEDEESVHLAAWPTVAGTTITADSLLVSMEAIRSLASRALKARETVNIKVRQPLASLTIPRNPVFSENNPYLAVFLEILKDEVNVREVIWADVEDLSLDTVVTPELEEEGFVRELIRAVQEIRKEKGFNPHESAKLTIYTEETTRAQIERHIGELQGTTKATSVDFAPAVENSNILSGRAVSFDIQRI